MCSSDLEDTQITSSCVKKRKKNTHPRTGCLAHMFVRKKEAWWYVEHCTDIHNHPLIVKPSLTRFLRAHRNIPAEEKRFRSEEHTSELQSHYSISYAVFCLGYQDYFLAPLSGSIALLISSPDRKSTRLNSSHITRSRMPSSA